MRIEPKYPKCPNCGAPLKGSKCSYCASEWIIDRQYIDEHKSDRKGNKLNGREDITIPDSENIVYVWLEATKPGGHVEDMDLFALVDYGNRVKLVSYASSEYVLGISRHGDDVKNYTSGCVIEQLKINVPELEDDVKSIKIYAKAYEDTNFGMSDYVHAKLVGYNHFNVGVDLSADFAIDNCIRLCTITKEKISLDLSACNFDREISDLIERLVIM